MNSHFVRLRNMLLRTFILWPIDQAISLCIWWIARREGFHAAEKEALIEQLRAQHGDDGLPEKFRRTPVVA